MSRMRTSKKCSKHLERVTHLKKTTNRHEIRKYGKALMQVRAFFLPARCFMFQVLMLPRNGYIVWGCPGRDRKSTRLNSSHVAISYAVFCLKKKMKDV